MKRIIDNVVINADGCWVWQKSKSSSGYGQFTEKGVYWNTHRYVFVTYNSIESIPKGMYVRHSCHNKACCNPEHLSLGTPKENWEDSRNTHKQASDSRRKVWLVDGVSYETCQSAVEKTGISMHSIIKFTKEGVFDRQAYEIGCRLGKRK